MLCVQCSSGRLRGRPAVRRVRIPDTIAKFNGRLFLQVGHHRRRVRAGPDRVKPDEVRRRRVTTDQRREKRMEYNDQGWR